MYLGTSNRPVDMLSAAAGLALVDAIKALRPHIPTELKSKEALRKIYRKKGMKEIVTLHRESADFSLVSVTHPINTKGAFKNLGTKELKTLSKVIASGAPGPPGGGMGGGMDWGKGEKGSVEFNKEVHFYKHCLRLKKYSFLFAVETDNPDQFEPWKWLDLLGYKIKRNFVETHVDFTDDAAQDLVDKKIFGSGNKHISTREQAVCFFTDLLPCQPALVAALEASYMPLYINHVRASTRNMLNAFVTVNGGKVQVVGVTKDDQFIVGKWDDTVGAFTISSSYINPEKLAENRIYRVWDL